MAETVLAYYGQADELLLTARELATWVDELPAPERLRLHPLGLRTCLALPSFRRSVLEQWGNAMATYRAAHLTPQELTQWVDDGDGGVAGP